ncbi:MAG: HlyD family efflux transporter periplasmic adaptor subunit [Cyanobacteria bacterium]|nr:HlyD family efflux transporter periplasmic adaptor subunit [Cyanobacteriota bacterium]
MTAPQSHPPERPATGSASPLKAVPPSQRAALRQGPALRKNATAPADSSPPQTGAPLAPPAPAADDGGTPATAAPVVKPPKGGAIAGQSHWRRWGVGVFAVCGVVAIAHIPVSPPVNPPGELRLPETQTSRESIYAPEVGIIKEIVSSNKRVEMGDRLVEFKFPELEKEANNLALEIERQKVALQEARSRSQAIQGRVSELQAQLLLVGQQAMRSQDRANRNQSPDMAVYEAERQELRAKQATFQGQAQATQKMATDIRSEIEDYKPLAEEGGISNHFLNAKNAELARHERDLELYQNQIKELESRIAGVRAKEDLARRSLGDQSVDRKGEFQQVRAALDAAIVEKSASEESVALAQSLIGRYRQEMNQVLQKIEDNRVIYAKIAGRVHSSTDLVTKLNAKVDPKDLLFEIIDGGQLKVLIRIDQADRDVVRKGMAAQIRPVQSDQLKQTVILQEDASVMQQDETQQKSQLLYFATIDNPDNSLRPGEQVYVTILTEPMPLYRVVGRELSYLFKINAFF